MRIDLAVAAVEWAVVLHTDIPAVVLHIAVEEDNQVEEGIRNWHQVADKLDSVVCSQDLDWKVENWEDTVAGRVDSPQVVRWM